MRDNNPAMFAYVSESLNEGIRRGKTPRAPREENFMTIHLGPALDYLIEDTRINNEKNRLIFPIKNDKIKRSKINELNAYQ